MLRCAPDALDSKYGNGLNGPSRGKLLELMRFMFAVEALEGEP